jgi:predicted nucleic acid-binding protein
MVAAVCEWHEHHSAATTEIERRLSRGERRMVPAHALAEAYAVLTRLPPPLRRCSRSTDAISIRPQPVSRLSSHEREPR